jgi:transcriptional regulator with XRE-family HTH domain
MAKNVPAIVEKGVLEWARLSAGYTVDEAARKLKIKPKSVEDWESGGKRPSIGQVRNMATVYKRPFHFFFLGAPRRTLPSLMIFADCRSTVWRGTSPNYGFKYVRLTNTGRLPWTFLPSSMRRPSRSF